MLSPPFLPTAPRDARLQSLVLVPTANQKLSPIVNDREGVTGSTLGGEKKKRAIKLERKKWEPWHKLNKKICCELQNFVGEIQNKLQATLVRNYESLTR